MNLETLLQSLSVLNPNLIRNIDKDFDPDFLITYFDLSDEEEDLFDQLDYLLQQDFILDKYRILKQNIPTFEVVKNECLPYSDRIELVLYFPFLKIYLKTIGFDSSYDHCHFREWVEVVPK